MRKGLCKAWLGIRNTPLDPDGPTSARNIGFMRRCIDNCIDDCTHDFTDGRPSWKSMTSNLEFVPRRLLDLGDSNSCSARLIECSQTLFSLPHPETQLPYATLSYCWGNSLTMTTTLGNKLKHETTGINVCNMPATFQDAIYVTKKLGIRYLWIDALCIVQDDKDDWEAEAITMCDVFAHSKVTISAAKSSSSAEHFLQRSADETLTLDFRSTLRPDILGQYSIRLEPRHQWPAQEEIAQSAWVSRAWVWQEDKMSTRQLVFGNKTLQFWCDEGILLEDGRREHYITKDLHRSTYLWKNLVAAYSSRKLTYASDRLKAIAGVAKVFESSKPMDGKPERYLVGLWQDSSFHWQLCWLCNEPSLSTSELMGLLRDGERYIAPSWSWASRNTGVHFFRHIGDTAIRVVESDLRASHKSTMVSVAFGSSITLCGKLSQTPVEPSSGHLVPDTGQWIASSTYGRTDFWLDWVPKKDDEEESRFQRQLCLFMTGVLVYRSEYSISGLILAPVLDTETGVLFYHRVGVFRHYGDDEWIMSQPEREITIR